MTEFDLPARAAFRGVEDSINGLSSHNGEESIVAAAQCLFWLCVIDERLSVSAGYRAERDRHPDGSLLSALRVARNAFTHGASVIFFPAQLEEIVGDDRMLVVSSGRWADFASLADAFDEQHQPRKQVADVWDERLRGRSPIATVSVVLDWLRGAAERYEDLLAPRSRGSRS